MEPRAAEVSPQGAVTERRIAWLTLLIGFAAGGIVAVLRDPWWGTGLAIGAGLAWPNFPWLRQGLDALVAASPGQSWAERPRVPGRAYFRSLFRYALIGFRVYAIFTGLR